MKGTRQTLQATGSTPRRDFLRLSAGVLAGGATAGAPGTASAAQGIVGTPAISGGSPWGIATSHSRSFDLSWLAEIRKTGTSWLRGFDRDNVDASLDAANAAGFNVTGILQTGAAFPVDDASGWEAHVTSLVEAAAGRVKHWEVWNEPPNFSTDKSPESYAALVAKAHRIVKRLDPDAQVGLCAASVNLTFMEQAILAGAAGHYDYITLHPYESLSRLERGFEPLFLSIVPNVRKMLQASDAERSSVPIVFTELGVAVGADVPGGVSAQAQALTYLKAYVLSLAQGVARVHWFEGIDGDSGPFGLMAQDGTRRPAYYMAAALIEQLGAVPEYLGWLAVGDRPQAFLFDGAQGPLLIGWASAGTSAVLDFGSDVKMIDALTGTSRMASTHVLDDVPVFIRGVPADVVERAMANRERPVPWGGDFSTVDAVNFTAPDGRHGLHALSRSTALTLHGTAVRDQSVASAHEFAVDPNFSSYDTVPLRIVAEVRRTGAAAAGFNLRYESRDGIVSTGNWNSVPADDGWHTVSWDIDDARFVGKWGYHISLDSDSTDHSQYALRRLSVEKR